MRTLRTLPTRRLLAIAAAVVAVAVGGGIAQAALSGAADPPPPKPLDRAVYDALRAPAVEGITARISFTNDLLPAGSLPDNASSPVAEGADGRLWMTADGRLRLELQSGAGDAQITIDDERAMLYDSTSNTVYSLALPADGERPHDDAPPTLESVRRGLDRLARVWTLSGAQPTTTAGRPTYTVRLAPKDDGGLLGAAELAGLPRRDVRLVRSDDALGAVAVYGEGMGAIAVLQAEARPADDREPPVRLPQVNIDGATGTELATALGTIVTFERDGVSYVVAGSVPPLAAENAARELR